MTSQGSPYSRFRRAIKTGNLRLIQTAALELPRVQLDDAAAICAVIAERHPDRFDAAGVRWILRLCDERQGLTLAQLRDAVDALEQLRTEPASGLQRLHPLSR